MVVRYQKIIIVAVFSVFWVFFVGNGVYALSKASRGIALSAMMVQSAGDESIIVLPFVHSDGHLSNLSYHFAESVTTEMRKFLSHMFVIRDQNVAIGYIQKFDYYSVTEMCELASENGISFVMVGKITNLGSEIEISSEIYDSKTRKVLTSDTRKVKITDEIQELISQKRVFSIKSDISENDEPSKSDEIEDQSEAKTDADDFALEKDSDLTAEENN